MFTSREELHSRMVLEHKPPNTPGHTENLYMMPHRACMIPDNKWRRYHATCQIGNYVDGYNYETADDLIERLGEIISLRLIIEGPSNGINLYIDDVKFEYFERNRDWVAGADLRIKEFRTRPVEIEIENAPTESELEIKMIKNSFPFGGRMNSDLFADFQEEWKYYFNYGFATVQTKWKRVEPERGDREFGAMDELVAKFNEWNIPISGDHLLWEANEGTPGQTSGTPEWYRDELTEYLKNDESAEPLRPSILSYVRDTVTRYKDRVVSYKIFNEPCHGEEYRGNYENIWQEAFE